MSRLAAVVAAGVCAVVVSGAAAGSAPVWTVTSLGTLTYLRPFPGVSSAIAINARGEIIGSSGEPFVRPLAPVPCRKRPSSHAFVWRSGRMIDLGTLGGRSTAARAINGNGAVVGSSDVGGCVDHAFLWRNGKMTDLGTLGGKESAAVGINDRGQVVGWSDLPGSTQSHPHAHAFLWQNGAMTDLGTLGAGSSQAVAINERGQVIGQSNVPHGGEFRPLLWQDAKMTELSESAADVTALNDRGEIIGSRNAPGRWRHGLLSGTSFDRNGKAIAALWTR